MLYFEGTNPIHQVGSSVVYGEDVASWLVLWIGVCLLYHIVLLVMDGESFFSTVTAPLAFRVSSRSFRDACPRRIARWYKCAKRCEKRCEKQSPAEECYFAKCAMNLVKLHLPPPLPLKPKKKSEKTASKESSPILQEKVKIVSTVGTVASPEVLFPIPRVRQPTVPLIDLARMQYWESLVKHVSRRGAKYRDSDGLYPLHWAVSGGPTLEAVQALLEAYPSAARKTDREGSTALHFATHYCASAPVIEAVLKAYPKSVRVQDRFGRTPLYHAVEKTAGLDVLDLLIREDPSVVTLPCLPHGQRDVPMSRAVAQRTPLYMAWSAVLLDKKARQTRRGRKWEKAHLLLEEAYKYSFQENISHARPYNFVCAAIYFDQYLPNEVLSMAVTMHPDCLTSEDDSTKRLPLLKAAASPMSSRQRSDEVISLLLESYPAGAMTRDLDGKTALHLALESGKPWTAGVGRLFDANPDAIYWTDNNCLAPALSAATFTVIHTEGNASKELEDENPLGLLTPKEKEILRCRRHQLLKPTAGELGTTDTEQLSSILNLLSANPSVIPCTRK
eukprot:scaffold394_cov166-Amphora_coffeaeformis.AAC.3